MERLEARVSVARKALNTFLDLAGPVGYAIRPSSERRDAAIQRFEYSFEAVWKAVQLYLSQEEALSIGSPKGCIRASREVGFLDESEAETALKMADARNLTAHTYDEGVANSLYENLPAYAASLDLWLGKVEKSLQ